MPKGIAGHATVSACVGFPKKRIFPKQVLNEPLFSLMNTYMSVAHPFLTTTEVMLFHFSGFSLFEVMGFTSSSESEKL